MAAHGGGAPRRTISPRRDAANSVAKSTQPQLRRNKTPEIHMASKNPDADTYCASQPLRLRIDRATQSRLKRIGAICFILWFLAVALWSHGESVSRLVFLNVPNIMSCNLTRFLSSYFVGFYKCPKPSNSLNPEPFVPFSRSIEPPSGQPYEQLKSAIQTFVSTRKIEEDLQNSVPSQKLKNHTAEFRRRIECITRGVYVAIGYGLANVVILETGHNNEIVLIDTLESSSALKEVLVDWTAVMQNTTAGFSQSFTPTPLQLPIVKCVVFTHAHLDHVFGTAAVVQNNYTEIWAHQKTDAKLRDFFEVVGAAVYKRSMRQFGSVLSYEDGFLNAGIGHYLQYHAHLNDKHGFAIPIPTHVWSGKEKMINCGGRKLHLFYAPGESPDQIVAWLPEERVLVGADNIYKAFPNIYAIRGTKSRDALQWVRSLDLMRYLRPDFLVLGHTGPLRGREHIWKTITAYRDAIQFVHDQTVRYMNKGRSLEEIVDIVTLPPHLRDHPFLQEFYGTVAWAVRAVFNHYLGGFSGSPVDLHPLGLRERAQKMANLVGGQPGLLQHAISALARSEYQWALELATFAQRVSPRCTLARSLRVLSLRGLASSETSAPGRNWYLTAAREALEEPDDNDLRYLCTLTNACTRTIDTSHGPSKHRSFQFLDRWFHPQRQAASSTSRLNALLSLPLGHLPRRTKDRHSITERMKVSSAQQNQYIWSARTVFESFQFLPVRIRGEIADTIKDAVIAFNFTDVDGTVCLHIRGGVGYPKHTCERPPNFKIVTTDRAWRQLVTRELSPMVALTTGQLRITGGRARDYFRLIRMLQILDLALE